METRPETCEGCHRAAVNAAQSDGAHGRMIAPMDQHITPLPAPSLRQILSFRCIEHASDRRREYHRTWRDRRQQAAAVAGIEVTHLEPEVINVGPTLCTRDTTSILVVQDLST